MCFPFSASRLEQQACLNTRLFSVLSTDPQLVAAFSAIGVFALFLNATRLQSPVAKRSYPYAGLESELGGRNAARVEEEAMDDE